MLNLCVFQGRLVKEPEFRSTTNGDHCATFTIAVKRNYKAKGSDERPTDFINVVTWRHLADFVSKSFLKGQMALCRGALQSRKWVDKDGNNRIQWELIADDVLFCGDKTDNAPAAPYKAPDIFDHNDGDTFTELGGDDGELPF